MPTKKVKRLKIGRSMVRVNSVPIQDDAYYGLYLVNPREIEINKELIKSNSQYDIAETLLHEIFHSIWDTWKLPDRTYQEKAVNTIAKGITQVFHDNKGLLEHLSELLKD